MDLTSPRDWLGVYIWNFQYSWIFCVWETKGKLLYTADWVAKPFSQLSSKDTWNLWWFQRCCFFPPPPPDLLGEMIPFDHSFCFHMRWLSHYFCVLIWFHVSKLARFPCCLPAMRKKIQKRVEKQVDHWTWNNLRCSPRDMACLKLKDIVK